MKDENDIISFPLPPHDNVPILEDCRFFLIEQHQIKYEQLWKCLQCSRLVRVYGDVHPPTGKCQAWRPK